MRRRLFDEGNPDVASSLENLAILQVASASIRGAGILPLLHGYLHACAVGRALAHAIAESAAGAALTGLGNYPEAEKRSPTATPSCARTRTCRPLSAHSREQYLQTLHAQQRRAPGGPRRAPAGGTRSAQARAGLGCLHNVTEALP